MYRKLLCVVNFSGSEKRAYKADTSPLFRYIKRDLIYLNLAYDPFVVQIDAKIQQHLESIKLKDYGSNFMLKAIQLFSMLVLSTYLIKVFNYLGESCMRIRPAVLIFFCYCFSATGS